MPILTFLPAALRRLVYIHEYPSYSSFFFLEQELTSMERRGMSFDLLEPVDLSVCQEGSSIIDGRQWPFAPHPDFYAALTSALES